MSYDNIIFEKEGNVAIIKFNRPKALNAINPDVFDDVNDALDRVEKDGSIKVLVLTGEGDKAFVAGADISHMINLSPLKAREFSRMGQDFLFRLEELPIPVIAWAAWRSPWQAILYTPPKMQSSANPKSTWVSSQVLEGPRGFHDWRASPLPRSFA